jgi:hypothetical protein
MDSDPDCQRKKIVQPLPASTYTLYGRDNTCKDGLVRRMMQSPSFEVDGPSLCRTANAVDHSEVSLSKSLGF